MLGRQQAQLQSEWRCRRLVPYRVGQIPGMPGWELLQDMGNWPLEKQENIR